MMSSLLFYGFAILLLVTSCLVIFSRYSIMAVVYLLMTFILVAMLWITLHAEFLALALIFIYVGAAVVLLLFMINLLHLEREVVVNNKWLFAVGLILVLLITAVITIFSSTHSATGPLAVIKSQPLTTLGNLIYTKYFVVFQVTALLLLAVILGVLQLVKLTQVEGSEMN